MYEYSPEYLHMGTSRLKYDKETEEESKQKLRSKDEQKQSGHKKNKSRLPD